MLRPMFVAAGLLSENDPPNRLLFFTKLTVDPAADSTSKVSNQQENQEEYSIPHVWNNSG